MKKRILVLLLALVLALGLATVALADSENYEVGLGEKYTHMEGDTEVTYYAPGSIERAIIDPTEDTVTTFDYYVLLFDYESNTEAPTSEYEKLWANYDVVVEARDWGTGNLPTNVTVSEVKSEGLRKFVTVTVYGTWAGNLSAWFEPKDGESEPLSAGNRVVIAAAEKLTLNEKGKASFCVEDEWGYYPYYFYLELDEQRSYTLSGALNGEEKGMIRIFCGQVIWQRRGDKEPNVSEQVVSGQPYVILEAQAYRDGAGTFSGVVCAEPEQPGLKFREMWWNGSAFEEDESWELQKVWNASRGDSRTVKVYFFDGKDNHELALSDLTSSGSVIIRADDGFIRMDTAAFGEGGVSYTTGGKTYTLPVTVALPDYGFYSTQTASEASFLTEVKVTQDNQVIYFVANGGGTISGVEMDDDFAAIASAKRVSDTCWKFTITGAPGGYYYGIEYSGTTADDHEFSGWDNSIKLIDARPGLRYREMAWNGSAYVEDMDWELRSSWETDRGSSRTVKFYFFDGTQEQVLALDDLTFSGSVIGKPESGFVRMETCAFGEGSVSYTTGGKTYSVPVTVGLPDFGYYSSQTVSEASFLAELKVTQDNQVVYFLAKTGGTISTVELDGNFKNIATAQKVSDTCWKITITAAPGGYNYGVRYSGTDPDGRQFSNWNCYVKITEGRPNLMARYMSWEGNLPYEDPSRELMVVRGMEARLDNSDTVRLYYGTPDSYVPVTEIEVTSGTSVTLYGRVGKDGPYLQLNYEKLGTSTLTYKVGNKTYTIDITVQMPEYGFFSRQDWDAEYLLNNVNYFQLEDGIAWLMCEAGMTLEEAQKVFVTQNDERLPDSHAIPVERGSGSGVYDVKIIVPPLAGSGNYTLQARQTRDWGDFYMANLNVDNHISGKAGYIGDYAIGFAWEEESTGIIRINEGNWSHGNGSDHIDDNYWEFRTLQVAAGIKKTDEQGAVYYVVDKNDKNVKLEVLKAWIQELNGPTQTFSLSDTAWLEERDDYTGTTIKLYSKQGYTAGIMIWAQVKVTIGDVTETFDVSMHCETTAHLSFTENRPMDDTVEKLNAYLAQLAQNLQPSSSYTVNLAPIDYNGTIVIPASFCGGGPEGSDLILSGTADENGNYTVINGAVNLNGATVGHMENLHLRGTSTETRGVYGGALLNMFSCTLTGYDIAVDASTGAITVTRGNVFVNNEMAVYVHIGFVMGGMNSTAWEGNSFINNGTAICIQSLNDFISSYYFRIINSNFINNGTDFDVRCKSTLYMYKNFYGQYKPVQGTRPTPGKYSSSGHNGRDDLRLDELLSAVTQTKLDKIVTTRGAKVTTSNGAKVITNPRWKFPVINWWWHGMLSVSDAVFGKASATPAPLALRSMEPEPMYENILVSDWDMATQIVNEEAGGLLVDASAFEEKGEKKIDVVDQNENPVGTWTFD